MLIIIIIIREKVTLTHDSGHWGQVTHFKTTPLEAGKIKTIDKIDSAMADEFAARKGTIVVLCVRCLEQQYHFIFCFF